MAGQPRCLVATVCLLLAPLGALALVNGQPGVVSARNNGHQSERDFSSGESRLMADIMHRYKHYMTTARPVHNASATLRVQLGVSLVQILDFDEKNQMISTLVWKTLQWHDELIWWEPDNYDAIESVRLPTKKIWVPDVILWNNADASRESSTTIAVVYHNGTVLWVPGNRYRSSCPLDMMNYPFDEQTCHFRFGSWTYDAHKLDLTFLADSERFDLLSYVPSSEWDIIENSARKSIIKYACCPEVYADITFALTVRRKLTFHLRLILVPTLLLSVMSLGIFWIPPRRPDRIGFGLTLFSSFFLLLITLIANSPPTATAKLGEYYVVLILLIFLGILLSMFTINMCQLKRNIPYHLEVFTSFMGRWLCLWEPVDRMRSPKKTKENDIEEKSAPSGSERQFTNPEKWEMFALVLDRIYFFIYVTALILSFILVFPSPGFIFGASSSHTDIIA